MPNYFPVTYWYSSLGVGDGQDMATRGYLRALLSVAYEHIMIAPRGGGINHLSRADLADLLHLFNYPKQFQPPDPRVQSGDPRIGQRWPHLDNASVGGFLPGAPAGAMTVQFDNVIRAGQVDHDKVQELREAGAYSWSPKTELAVLHYDPGQLARARDTVGRHSEGELPLVGITAWESSKVPAVIAQQLSDLDTLIVPSSHTKRAFLNSDFEADEAGIDGCRLVVVPHALDIEPLRVDEWEQVKDKSGRYVFYTIGTNIPRKNLTAIISAYSKAFAPGGFKDVGLVIKTSGDRASLKKLYEDGVADTGVRPKIKIYGDRWSDEKIRALHLGCDCWVDATRGEGFGLGVLDAAALGNPILTTSWGAQTEIGAGLGIGRMFLTPSTLVTVPEEMARIGVYNHDQEWADPIEEALVVNMRAVFEDRVEKCIEQSVCIKERYSRENIGGLLADVLKETKEREVWN